MYLGLVPIRVSTGANKQCVCIHVDFIMEGCTAVILFYVGATQQCERSASLSLGFGSVPLGVINTTDPFCFVCGGIVATFSLGGVMLTNTQDYFINMSTNTLVINNWTSLVFNPLQLVTVVCLSTDVAGTTYGGTFFSSRKSCFSECSMSLIVCQFMIFLW